MPAHRHLHAENQVTLETIFDHHRHAPRVEWTDLVHLIEEVGTVRDKGDGVYQFVVNGEHHEYARPRHDAITNADELAALRHFLERARMTP